MTTECFLPNCKNTVGVLFPKDPGLKNKWLNRLKIKDLNPNPSSFLCLPHFEEYVANKDGDFRKHNKDELLQQKNRKSGVTTALSPSKTNRPQKNELTNNGNLVKEEKKIGKAANAQDDTKENIKNIEEFKRDILTSTDLNICRLCTNETSDTVNIYDNFDPNMPNISIADAITSCLHPIKITNDDKLPNQICNKCLEKLREHYQFWYVCVGMDEKQHELLEIDSEDYLYCDSSDSEDDELFAWSGTSSPDQLEKLTKTEDVTVVNNVAENTKINSSEETEEKAVFDKKAEIDKKFDMVEEQLRLVLEGQLTGDEEDHMETENIIIDVVKDEDFNNQSKNPPLTIVPIKKDPSKTTTKRKHEVNGTTPVKSTRIKFGENNEVVLPKGIQVKIPEKFLSTTGTCPSTNISYLYDSKFCESNGCLYEYRLKKGDKRYLVCITPGCQSVATQMKDNSGKFPDMVTVEVEHNHQPGDANERKKLMFYCVMKHRMNIDRNLNFRDAYEAICTMDPEIREVVPLRNVINELCRHQLSTKMPDISSFDEFHELIEENIFNRLHFTHSNQQFYQERFTADDGISKAILFANRSVIQHVSKSKLMYVDASFKIDNTDSFNYQLVTVLAWTDDCYYPVVFILVNQKTQDIYKKVFVYLYETLAPNLRPDDIVTDYEANLYYALGETYVESNIGGSIFYFTQNLYKKICSVKLSRELETNSFFRNIYQMLLMLPLLPVNTIVDGLANIEVQARDLGVSYLTNELFEHVYEHWINKVTPELFCVHRLENRINENVIGPFKKFRDYIMLQKGKHQKKQTIVHIVEKLIELENFLSNTYFKANKRNFAKDLSSSQKKNVLRAWQYIESNPKININSFFSKVLGYIKCMENQLWIWGFYRYEGGLDDDLINAANFSIYNAEEDQNEFDYAYEEEEQFESVNYEPGEEEEHQDTVDYEPEEEDNREAEADEFVVQEEGQHEVVAYEPEEGEEEMNVIQVAEDEDNEIDEKGALVMEAVIDENGRFVVQNSNGSQCLKNGVF